MAMNSTSRRAGWCGSGLSKVNRIAAIGIDAPRRRGPLLLKPETLPGLCRLCAISGLFAEFDPEGTAAWKRARLGFSKNLAAYVSVSDHRFLVSLFGSRKMFEHISSIIFYRHRRRMAVLVLYAILRIRKMRTMQ